jgi:hypothetical protein
MKRSGIVSYVKAQVLSKSPDGEHQRVLAEFKEAMLSFGAGSFWTDCIEPVVADILKPRK